MNQKQTAAFKRAQALVNTAKADIEHHDRTDALDALRMATRELRNSMGELAVFLPKVKEVLPDTEVPYTLRVTFEQELTSAQRSVVRYTLNQLVA